MADPTPAGDEHVGDILSAVKELCAGEDAATVCELMDAGATLCQRITKLQGALEPVDIKTAPAELQTLWDVGVGGRLLLKALGYEEEEQASDGSGEASGEARLVVSVSQEMRKQRALVGKEAVLEAKTAFEKDLHKGIASIVIRGDRIGGGLVSCSGEHPPSENGAMVFDGRSDTKWLCFGAQTSGAWVSYTWPDGQGRKVVSYRLTCAKDHQERDPSSWELQGSNDGETWKGLHQVQHYHFPARSTCTQLLVLPEGDTYAWYRLRVTDVRDSRSANSLQLAKLDLFVSDLPYQALAKAAMSPAEDEHLADILSAIHELCSEEEDAAIICKLLDAASSVCQHISRYPTNTASIDIWKPSSLLGIAKLWTAGSGGRSLLQVLGFEKQAEPPAEDAATGVMSPGTNATLVVTAGPDLRKLLATVAKEAVAEAKKEFEQGMDAGLDHTITFAKHVRGGLVSCSGEFPPQETATLAFDGRSDTKWLCFGGHQGSSWISYCWADGRGRTVASYRLTCAKDHPERDPMSWELQASNSGQAWTVLHQVQFFYFPSRSSSTPIMVLQHSGSYSWYRLRVMEVRNAKAATSVQLSRLDLFLSDSPYQDGNAETIKVEEGWEVVKEAD